MNQIIHASPKVRKFARQLGADISQLKGSERNGRITEDDVRNFIKNQIKQQENPPKKTIKDEKKKLEFDHSEFGEIEVDINVGLLLEFFDEKKMKFVAATIEEHLSCQSRN